MACASIPQLAGVDRQRRRRALDNGLVGDRTECLFAEKVVRPVVGVAADPEVDVGGAASFEIVILGKGSVGLFFGKEMSEIEAGLPHATQ